jgi:outer membrane protein TolC
MRRWLKRLLGTIVACGLAGASAAGCKQQMFLSKDCFDQASMTLPVANVENDFTIGETPLVTATKAPATLSDPDRPARPITLREAIASALENGAVGDRATGTQQVSTAQFGNQSDDSLPTATAGTIGVQGFNSQIDRVKALALNPAIAGANLEASVSRFDPQWVTAMNWSATDNIQQGLASFTNGNTGQFVTSIVKGMASGGVAAMTFNNNYRQLNGNVPNAISPLYESRLDFSFEQPLWQNYGTDINQVLARFPSFNGTSAAAAAAAYNSRQNSGNTLGVGTEGILISRIRVEQQRAEFERRIHNMVLNVEQAYWNLYKAYGQLYTFEEVFRIAQKSWQTNYAKLVAGTIGPAVYSPIKGQYEEFRGERMDSLDRVLDAERNLRALMGLPGEDGTRLVPIDSPTLAPYRPNWEASVQMALLQKPEIAIARDNLRVAQFALVSQKNFLKPDLRFVARYSPVGFGTRLDGNGSLNDGAGIPRSDNALRSLAGSEFADWNLGLTLSMPLGFRLEHAAVRSARLQLAQSYYVLQDSETRLIRSLQQSYQKLDFYYQIIQARQAERKAYAEAVESRYREFAVGKATVADFLLEAQRRLAVAQVKEYTSIADYNIALAFFEYRKGNILKHNNVVIAEGPLPECAEVKAVDYERERAKALILRERPARPHNSGIFASTPMQDVPPNFQPPIAIDVERHFVPTAAPDGPARIEIPAKMPQPGAPNYSTMVTPPKLPAAPSASSEAVQGTSSPAGIVPASASQNTGVVEPANLPVFRSVPAPALGAPTLPVDATPPAPPLRIPTN